VSGSAEARSSRSHGRPPPPRWGWHRLTEPWAERIVAQASISPGELVLDIGAGTGALTAPLVTAGARVIAIELHPQRAQLLRDRFDGKRVRVLQVDVSDLRLPRRPFRVVANPPFGLTTALLRRLLHRHSQLVRADLVVPHHVAARWSAGRGSDARRWTTQFAAVQGLRLPGHAFVPPPPNPVSLLRLQRRSGAN
jgi:23S rRNA (adenine-N6)-dimethyltransferase